MKLLKKILIGLGILIAIPLIAALFMEKDFAITRNIVIHQPKQVVFDYLKLIKNQENFSTWTMMDPKMKMSYTGTDGMPGATAIWESETMGNGEQEIKSLREGERIDTEIRFKGMFPSISPAYFTTEAIDSTQTKVTWAMQGSMHYPMNFLTLFMSMEDMIGKEYQTSLENLKKVLETAQ
jgi:hypothetical protein